MESEYASKKPNNHAGALQWATENGAENSMSRTWVRKGKQKNIGDDVVEKKGLVQRLRRRPPDGGMDHQQLSMR
jgi:hypothetical protein